MVSLPSAILAAQSSWDAARIVAITLKYCASAACFVSLRYCRGAGAHPVVALWFRAFFSATAVSTAIGASLCVGWGDEASAPRGWNVVMCALMSLAGICSAVLGCLLLALGRCGSAQGPSVRARARLQLAVGLASLLSLASLALQITSPSADVATTYFALPGGALMLGGALAARQWWIATGVAGVAGGYCAAAFLLPAACDTGCTQLPVWLNLDGTYYLGLMVGLGAMGVGARSYVVGLAPFALGKPAAAAAARSTALLLDGGGGGGGAAAERDTGAPADSALLDAVHGAVLWVMSGVPYLGAQKTFAVKHAVNAHKACCPLVVAALMLWRGDDRLVSWVYLVMHGNYGLTWLLKDAWFPDASWERPATPGSFVALYSCLALFWVTPAILVGGQAPAPPNALVAAALASYCLGFFFLHTSDAQKFFTLRQRRGLIDDGFFSRTRNPNYFGELLIYSGFALMASGADGLLWLLPWSVNLLVWAILFVPNWYAKDRSMARHAGFAAYARRTGLVLPLPLDAARHGWWVAANGSDGDADE